MQGKSAKEKEEIFKKNVLKRLYGSQDTTTTIQEQTAIPTQIKRANTEDKRMSELPEKKVYTVALPPEDYNPDTECLQAPILSEDSSSSTSSDDEAVSSKGKRRRRKRGKSHTAEKECNMREENIKEVELNAVNRLTKNQKRKLKKKRQKEKQKKSTNVPFVYLNSDQKEEAEQSEITRQREAAELQKEKNSLLEFVDGVWDVMLAEGSSQGNCMQKEKGMKEALDGYIMTENLDQVKSIKLMCAIKQASMLKDRSLIQEKILEMKTLLDQSSSAVNFFFTIVNYWLEEVVKI